jgi:EmrB/QacA subfamily drug resistance transporter
MVPVLGPVIGGAILSATTWRWIFYLNVPIGVAALAAARRLPDAQPQLGQRLDLPGLLLLCPGIALLLYGMSEVGNTGGFSTRAILTAAVGLVLLTMFTRHARGRGGAALLDLSLFARRGFASSAVANFLLPMALFGTLLLLPLYYQLVRGQDTLHVGLLLAPQGLGAALAMPLAGWLTDKIGARVVVLTGVVIGAAGTAAFTQVGAHTSYPYLAVALLVLGIGIGATIMPSMAAAFQTLDRAETPRATSTLNAIQRIASALGTALLAVILQRAISRQNPGFYGGIQALSHAAAPAHAFGLTFWVAFGLIAAAAVPAILLPNRAAAEQTQNARRDTERQPVA